MQLQEKDTRWHKKIHQELKLYHSVRAKTNMTKQLRARLAWLKSDLKTEAKGLEKARYYCKLLGKNFSTSTSYKAYSKGILDTSRQIRELERLILRRQRNGECYKII